MRVLVFPHIMKGARNWLLFQRRGDVAGYCDGQLLRAGVRASLSVPAVVFHAEPDRAATGFEPMLIGVAQAVGTAAVFLLVKCFILGDINHAVRAAAFAPIIGPISKIVVLSGGTNSTAIDLIHILPA